MGGAADLPGFDKQQLKKAARSLLKYVGEQQQSGPAQLLDDDELLHLVIALKKVRWCVVGLWRAGRVQLAVRHSTARPRRAARAAGVTHPS
jgi:hypothetical protein